MIDDKSVKEAIRAYNLTVKEAHKRGIAKTIPEIKKKPTGLSNAVFAKTILTIAEKVAAETRVALLKGKD